MALKIVVAGPKQVGKTAISNFLSSQSEKLAIDTYNPTAGVRILEFETELQGSGPEKVGVEIWDISGDHTFEGCWRAVMNEADGVLLVYNPDAPSQDQQISDWFEYFVRRNGLKDEQCMVFAHRSQQNQSSERFRPPPLFTRVTAALTTLQSGPDMKSMFGNFLKEVNSIKRRAN